MRVWLFILPLGVVIFVCLLDAATTAAAGILLVGQACPSDFEYIENPSGTIFELENNYATWERFKFRRLLTTVTASKFRSLPLPRNAVRLLAPLPFRCNDDRDLSARFPLWHRYDIFVHDETVSSE